VLSGTDTTRPWARLLYVTTVALVAGAAFWRAAVPPRKTVRRTAPA